MADRSPFLAPRAAVGLFLGAFALLGYLSAHAIAYDLAGVAVDGHDHVHGYFSWLELAAGIGATLGFAGAIAIGFRGSMLARFLHPASSNAAVRRAVAYGGLMPAGVFVVAEYVERWAAGGPHPPRVSLLLIGIAVQVVVGVAAWMLARRCIRLVDAVLASRRDAAVDAFVRIASAPRPRPVDGPPVRDVMARSEAGRAPPRRRMPQS